MFSWMSIAASKSKHICSFCNLHGASKVQGLWPSALNNLAKWYRCKGVQLVVSFVSRYPRLHPANPFPFWQTSMREFIMTRLRHMNLTVYWKEYTATHFGGHTGTMTWWDQDLRPEPPLCEPASRGEVW